MPRQLPPIWTVPWFKYAQYDASIEQPLIRNAGEALGVTALLNLSSDYPADTCSARRLPSTNLHWIETMLQRPRSLRPDSKGQFGGLTAEMAVADFRRRSAWQIDAERVNNGRKLYAEICAECHPRPGQ